MYQIDKIHNRIMPLAIKRFSALGFHEREHLQEWLANEPTALGEELLVIQKEFDGFNDTRERLDLLALDKEGNLIIIENKLDDSGRDMVWQALKYASYCSTLTKYQVVDIFQKYLDRCCGGGEAQKLICEFLDEPNFDEVVINSGNNQRLILVAAQFRKEVTSTVLWLMGHSIRLQCFKATPYGMGENLFLNLEQIIPTPEAAEFMICISQKEAVEKTTEHELKNRQKLRLEFWARTLEALRASKTDLFNNISPCKDHWMTASSRFNLIFGNKVIRVEFQISRPNTGENKYLYDQLFARKEQIETVFGDSMSWERMDDKKSSYIRYGKDVDGDNRDNWPEMIDWLVDHIIKLEAAFKKPWADAVQALKKAGLASGVDTIELDTGLGDGTTK